MMYVVKTIKKDIEVLVLGQPIKIPLSFADGMVGALPVFATREEARKYCEGDDTLISVIDYKSEAK